MRLSFFSERFSRRLFRVFRFTAPPFVWMGVLFFLSSQSSLGGNEEAMPLAYFLARKGAHVVEYAVLSWLFFRMFSAFFRRNSHGAAAGTVLSSLLFAFSDEAHQLFVSGRHGRVSDVGFDAIGILFGIVFWIGILPRWRRFRNELREN